MVSATTLGLLYLLFAVVPAAMTVVAWRHRLEPAGVPLFVSGFGATVTAVAWGLWLLPVSPTVDSGALGLAVAYDLGIDAAVVGAFYVGVEYTGRDWLEAPSIVAGITAVVVGLTVASLGLVAAVVPPTLPGLEAAEEGVHVVLALGLLSMLAHRTATAYGVYRKQGGVLLGGFAASTAAGILDIAIDTGALDPLPVGLSIGAVAVGLALFRYDFLETAPVGRDLLFDRLTDPVLAVDQGGYVLTANAAAREVFHLDDVTAGDSFVALLRPDPDIRERYEDVLADPEIGVVSEGEVTHFEPAHPVIDALASPSWTDLPDRDLGVVTDGTVRYFQATAAPFGEGERPGSLVVFREVTTLKQREQELELLKQVQSRVLRHNIRNDVTVIRGQAASIADRTSDEVREMAEEVVATSENLVRTAEEARLIEDVMAAEGQAGLDLAVVVEEAVDRVRQERPAAEITVAVPDDLPVRANPYLGAAIHATLENAAVHGNGSAIEVRAIQEGPWVHLAVADDGPGIPQSELEAIQRGGETPLVHGSGAGLWLVKTVVEESRGRIRYDVSDGTTVHISLPAAG